MGVDCSSSEVSMYCSIGGDQMGEYVGVGLRSNLNSGRL